MSGTTPALDLDQLTETIFELAAVPAAEAPRHGDDTVAAARALALAICHILGPGYAEGLQLTGTVRSVNVRPNVRRLPWRKVTPGVTLSLTGPGLHVDAINDPTSLSGALRGKRPYLFSLHGTNFIGPFRVATDDEVHRLIGQIAEVARAVVRREQQRMAERKRQQADLQAIAGDLRALAQQRAEDDASRG